MTISRENITNKNFSLSSVADEDIISAMAFDTTGNYISLGDKAGRLIIFQKSFAKNKKGMVEYQYFSELQSHMREFDY